MLAESDCLPLATAGTVLGDMQVLFSRKDVLNRERSPPAT